MKGPLSGNNNNQQGFGGYSGDRLNSCIIFGFKITKCDSIIQTLLLLSCPQSPRGKRLVLRCSRVQLITVHVG